MDLSELLETKPLFHSTFDHRRFKNQIVILVATHWHLNLIQKSLKCILAVLHEREDVFVVILDNDSDTPIRDYLKSIKHPRMETHFVGENLGKAAVINNYIRTYISESTLPKLFVVIDPDITFSAESFNTLVHAAENIPRIGMLSMRYEKNSCNPESHLIFPPKRIKGSDGKVYSVSIPFMSNVAGGIFAVRGKIVLNRLKGRLFPKKKYDVYWHDDAALHDALKWKYRNGYLNGTLAKHYKSGDKLISDEPI